MEPYRFNQPNSSVSNPFGNVTEQFDPIESTISLNSTFIYHRKLTHKPYIILAVILLLSILSIVSNARVCAIVTCTHRKFHRTVSILVAHLTVITIASNLHEILYFADKFEFVILRAPYFCGVISFVRNTLHATIPLNLFAIIYERVRTLKVTETTLLLYRTILLVWIVAAVGSFPSLFCYKFEPDATGRGFGQCKKVVPFVWLIVYELGRLIFFHVFICGCIAWALYTIRSQLKYLHFLQPILTERIRRKVYRIRFVYCYAILFIIFYVAIGILVFLKKVLPTVPGSISSVNFIRLAVTLTLLYYTYCILNPLIYICLNEDMSVRSVLGVDSTKRFCARVFLQNETMESSIEMATTDNEQRGRRDVAMSDFSQFPTFGLSERMTKPNEADIYVLAADENDEESRFSENKNTFV